MATMSYVSGPSDVPLIGNTIGQQLEATAGRFPDRLALVVRQQHLRLTWRELDAQAPRSPGGRARAASAIARNEGARRT